MSRNTLIVIGVVVVALAAFLIWLFVASSQPLPGQKIADLGRKHVPIGQKVEYNSNPPTSGDHYADWIRSGVYDSPRDDRNLVHSLEHGYVIMHYKCSENSENSENRNVSGSDNQTSDTSDATDSSDLSGTLSTSEFSEECKTRKEQLVQVYEKKGKRKLIVIPRSDLDSNFALTAWNYIDKLNDFDQARIEKFIDAHLNQGPEKTME